MSSLPLPEVVITKSAPSPFSGGESLLIPSINSIGAKFIFSFSVVTRSRPLLHSPCSSPLGFSKIDLASVFVTHFIILSVALPILPFCSHLASNNRCPPHGFERQGFGRVSNSCCIISSSSRWSPCFSITFDLMFSDAKGSTGPSNSLNASRSHKFVAGKI